MSSSIPSTMQAIVAHKYGTPSEVLHLEQVPVPKPHGRDLLVRLYSGATNPVDYKKLNNFGNTSAEVDNPLIAGYDGAGVVEAVGPDAHFYKVGDQVYFAGALNRAGTFAEYTVVDERIVGKKPKQLSWNESASIPLVALTVWESLVEELGIRPDDEEKTRPQKTILIIGGAGGVGSFAIQIAKHVLKLRVVATASRPESVEYCKKVGADVVISHKKPLLPQLNMHNIQAVPYVFNTVDTVAYFNETVDLVEPLGSIVNINGTNGIPLDIGRLMAKRISFHFEFMFARPLFGAAPEQQKVTLDRISELLDAGVIHHTLNQTFEFSEKGILEALAVQESGTALGKLGFTIRK